MKKNIFIGLTCLLSIVARSQTKSFYYFKGEKIPLEVDKYYHE